MARRSAVKHSQGVIVIAVFAFVLSSVPKMNIRIGPVPLYLIDLLIILVTYYAFRRPGFGATARPFVIMVITLFLFALAGEVVGFIYTAAVFDHAYLIGRTALAFLVFYAAGQLIRTPQDLLLVLKALSVGLILTSLLMILTSLPQTRALTADLVLNNSFLDPAGKRVAQSYLREGDTGVRGRTLIGVSIMGASFINIVWPLVAILYVWPRDIGVWRKVAMVACFLAPLGVLMSYSRGPIIGSILIILATTLLGLRYIRKGILVPLGVSAALVLSVGLDSEAFFFDRLVNRTTAVLENPYEDERESERIMAYIEPFEHVAEHPEFLLTGQGNAIARSRTVVPEIAGKASHALFAAVYYSQGMVAAILYMFLLINMFYYTLRHMRMRDGGPGAMLAQALLASSLGILPWAVFGHAIVTTPRGAMMFFFILGLMSCLRHFPISSPTPQLKGGAYGYRHPVAV